MDCKNVIFVKDRREKTKYMGNMSMLKKNC